MAPSHVVLDPVVRLVPFPDAGGCAEGAGFASGEALGDGYPESLRAVKLVPDITDPPGISTLSLHLPSTLCGRDGLLPSAHVESSNGNLVLLYAGPYVGKGYLLIYDAKKDSLSAIPQFDSLGMGCGTLVGYSTVVVRRPNRSDDYVIAQLMSNPGGRRAGFSLLLWFSPSSTEWEEKLVHTPHKALASNFMGGASFVFDDGGSKTAVCWVDLQVCILVLDMSELSRRKPELRFIALPEGYETASAPHKRLGNPGMFRTIGCVRGAITFLSVDGYKQKGRRFCSENVTATTWTLKPSLEGWERDERTSLRMTDLFEDGLVLCPVLSMREHHMVYFFSKNAPPQSQHGSVVRVNMLEKKVESSRQYPLRINGGFPSFIASTFSRYVDRPSYRLPDQDNRPAKRIKL